MGADVSDDVRQLGMLSVCKPDTKAPIGIAKEVKVKSKERYTCVPAALLVCAARNHRYNYAVHLWCIFCVHHQLTNPYVGATTQRICRPSLDTQSASIWYGSLFDVSLLPSHVQNRGSAVYPVKWQIRSIFRKCNNGIPIDRPEAHDVSLGPVFVSLEAILFKSFSSRSVSPRTIPHWHNS